jgi:hypothetical protein
MSTAGIRRCSLIVLALQAGWVAATFAAREAGAYLGVLGAALQVVLAATAAGIAAGIWLCVRPRGAGLAWTLAMPALGAAASVVTWLAAASFRWGC